MIKLEHKPLDTITITSKFGNRADPITKAKGFHSGVDLGCRTGTKVYAMHDGVIQCGFDQTGGGGNFVKIMHEDGWHTRYLHNSKLQVKPGQRVKAGDVIALSGATGRVTGPHLHVTLCLGNDLKTAVDPMPYIEAIDKLPAGVTRKKFKLNGKLVELKATMIDGENYPNFRELMQALGFNVDYSPADKLPIAYK